MLRWPALLGVLLCSSVMVAAEASAQPAMPPPPPPGPPPQPGQTQIVTAGPNGTYTTQGNGQQPTIIVIQEGPNRSPILRHHTIPAEDGQPPPPGYHEETRMMKGLAIAGFSVLGAGYVISAIGGAGVALSCINDICPNFSDSGYVGLIPIAGPWIYVSNSRLGGARILFGLLGVMQAGGLAMGIAGVAARTDVWVSNDVSKNPYAPRVGVGHLTFTANF